ncbi:heat-inducible transcriptional repressor HrcA [Yunchengibacter salinarum]|uniref:heat-inducible transcriptional repressor HrcA n=1 Tax=Yunchengibacter salinarum TaxID=3133399 RepID=UPI0035B6724A
MTLTDLTKRNQDIFRRIVETYLDSGEPVGSKTIALGDGISVSPATVRNVMRDLERAGLLAAPHTSAGRIPTDTGLRLFVDGLMQVGNLSARDRAAIRGHCEATGRSMEDLLGEATKALSGLSNLASVVMVPKEHRRVRHMEFVSIAPDRALVVLVGEDDSVENRLVSLPPGLPSSSLVQASNYLSSRLAGHTLEEATRLVNQELSTRKAELDQLTSKVVEEGLAVWSGEETEEASLIVTGQGHLLEDVRAVEELERVRQLFDELERKRDLARLLELAREGEGVRLFIGSETKLFSLSGSSLVVSPYMRGDSNELVGVIGVIGPTRLNYARVIPMVDYTARTLSRLLG